MIYQDDVMAQATTGNHPPVAADSVSIRQQASAAVRNCILRTLPLASLVLPGLKSAPVSWEST
jgi:hypothetical protein